jgi:hypothetical protein
MTAVAERLRELVNLGEATEPERLALMQDYRAVIDYKIVTYGGRCGS